MKRAVVSIHRQVAGGVGSQFIKLNLDTVSGLIATHYIEGNVPEQSQSLCISCWSVCGKPGGLGGGACFLQTSPGSLKPWSWSARPDFSGDGQRPFS